MVFVFTFTSVITAALLFLVQPMVARMVLPTFGGSPQVWTTAMLFFQTALLAGYGYTHLATTWFSRKVQLGIHFGVLALPLILLPIQLTVAPSGKGGVMPSLELLLALSIGVAVPFMVIATSGPLVQRWFSWTNHPRANDPYFLYAAGNIGSLGGLLLYPFLVEPNLSVSEQTRWWMWGYGIAASLLAMCGLWIMRSLNTADAPSSSPAVSQAPLTWKRISYWTFLAFVPSSLMLGITAHLSTDVASIPMLWILPLVTYLLTFTIAFSRFGPQALKLASWAAPVVVVAALFLRVQLVGTNATVGIQVLLMLVGGLIGHGKLSEDRPDPARLTQFYVILSIGGALGGVFNGLLAPLIFPHIFEYGLAVTATLALVTQWKDLVVGSDRWPAYAWIPLGVLLFIIPMVSIVFRYKPDWLPAWAQLVSALILLIPLCFSVSRSGVVCLGVLVASLMPQLGEVWTSKSIERTFFGVHRVMQYGNLLRLVHGTTTHGQQDMSSEESRAQATTYYHADQPLGDLIRELPTRAQIGVIGLGAGTIAAYGNAERAIRFHEIDPAVVRIAEQDFTYIQDARARGANVSIELGDGRLTLADQTGAYDFLAIDAFSSDAIPVHLLTLEAIEVYLNAIKPDGIIGIHISNHYLDLVPVLAGSAEELNLAMLRRLGKKVADKSESAEWVVVARNPDRIEALKQAGWNELPGNKILWTDQRSSIWSVLKK